MTPRTTVIIATLNRPTLSDSIWSSLDQGLPVIVVGDGAPASDQVKQEFSGYNVEFYHTKTKFGTYGCVAYNVAAYLAGTEFVTQLADDDILLPRANSVLHAKFQSRPDVDVWIPGLIYHPDKGRQICMSGPMQLGNVACPTMRTAIFTRVPFLHPRIIDSNWYLDFSHILRVVEDGYRLAWVGEPLYEIKPNFITQRYI